MSGEPRNELERLRAENAQLHEQVKLLVRTEQRLYRSRTERDRQLAMIRSVADFALRCSAADGPGVILDDAAAVLRDIFDVDAAIAIRPGGADFSVWRLRTNTSAGIQERDVPVPTSTVEWSRGRQGVRLSTGPAIAEAIGPLSSLGSTVDDDRVGLLAMRAADDRPSSFLLLVRRAGRSDSRFKELLEEGQVPFLTVFARHVESALAAVQLTARLRERTRELADTNERLTESLDRLRQTQEQLGQAQKMEAIGRLAGGIAHDFNNLLTIILGRAERVMSHLPAGSEAHDELAQIVDASDRAAAITRRLLAFSRGPTATPGRIDMNAVVLESATMLESLIGDDVVLDLRLSPGIGRVHADAEQLQQALLNLVLNARDAMPDGGIITLETRDARPEDLEDSEADLSATDCIALSVTDTGHGIEPAIRPRIFEPYFTTKSPGRSNGLGLAMVYGLMAQNGGSVRVVSDVGRGSTFSLVLPVGTSRPAAPAPPPAAEERLITVLLVEDEDGIRSFAAHVLRRDGYRVLEARDGAEGLRVTQEETCHVDVLVTDVVMPRLGGLQLARSLRRTRPNLPVLFISGYPSDAAGNGREELAEPYLLQKPFTAGTLLERLRLILSLETPASADWSAS